MPANSDNDPIDWLSGVSCPSPSDCVAVGAYEDSGEQGLLVTLSKGSWTATKAPLPVGAADLDDEDSYGLTSVSCSSSSACIVGGAYNDTGHSVHGLLLTLAGGVWTAAEAPQPSVIVSGVSCRSAVACIAVGSDDTEGSGGLLLTLSAGAWTAAEAPALPSLNSDPHDALLAVSCSSDSDCVAAGYHADDIDGNTAQYLGTLLTLSGGSWTAAEPPLPASATRTDTIVRGVSCSSPTDCVAVGGYTTINPSLEHGLLLTEPK